MCDKTGRNNSGELLICDYTCVSLLKWISPYFCFEFGTLVVLKVPYNDALPFLSLSSKDYKAVLLAPSCCLLLYFAKLLYCFTPETAAHQSLIEVSLPCFYTLQVHMHFTEPHSPKSDTAQPKRMLRIVHKRINWFKPTQSSQHWKTSVWSLAVHVFFSVGQNMSRLMHL